MPGSCSAAVAAAIDATAWIAGTQHVGTVAPGGGPWCSRPGHLRQGAALSG